MSHAVVRGPPARSQLYFDGILDSIIRDGCTAATTRDRVNLAEVLYYCLRTHSTAIHTINAATGESFTNERILKRAVSIARALTALSVRETVVVLVENHEHMSALYYAMLFAGVVPFMLEPGSTEYEIQQFLPLLSPHLIFCERDRRDNVISAVRSCDVRADVVVADGPSLDKFVEGYSEDFESYKLPEMTVDSTAIILPTSGSTGVPKAAMLTHQGMLMQIPSSWLNDSQFPHPTRLKLLVSNAQWITHTVAMNTCPVYEVPILMWPVKITAETYVEIAEKYRPTWSMLNPSLAARVGHVGTPEQLSSFKSMYVGGSAFTAESVAALKDKLPSSVNLRNSYGMTEAHGHLAAVGAPRTPLSTVGHVVNIFEYKLIDSNGEEVSNPTERGELYIRSKFLFKGYVNNNAAYNETVTPDGWLKTGDVFYTDESGQLSFNNRTKLGFKHLNYQIYPEEIERVIASVPGVQQAVVCGAEAGPAAAVILQPGCDVSRETILQAVNSTLSDYKRLSGGVAFVHELPHTPSGKLDRVRCLQLIQELVNKGNCF